MKTEPSGRWRKPVSGVGGRREVEGGRGRRESIGGVEER